MIDSDHEHGLSRARRRTILLCIALVWAGGVAGFQALGRAWLWRKVELVAAQQGLRLFDCAMELGWGELSLGHCRFEAPVGAVPGAASPGGGIHAEGSVAGVTATLSGFSLGLVTVRGLDARVTGEPRLRE